MMTDQKAAVDQQNKLLYTVLGDIASLFEKNDVLGAGEALREKQRTLGDYMQEKQGGFKEQKKKLAKQMVGKARASGVPITNLSGEMLAESLQKTSAYKASLKQ